VKTLVQDEVQREKFTFFTARSLASAWANSLGTVLDRPNRQCKLGSEH
jgi:hypothetical protein